MLVEDLTFRYHRRSEPSIFNISLRLMPGEILLLSGASGCGKTTLMRCMNGLIPRVYRGDVSGKVSLFGTPVEKLSMAELSRNVGTLLQDPERQIVGSYVLNELAFGLENLGLPRGEILDRVDTTLDYLGISHLRDRENFYISGGEKQKVALAGVLVMQPRILLLDVPLASLDPVSKHASCLFAVLRHLLRSSHAIRRVQRRALRRQRARDQHRLCSSDLVKETLGTWLEPTGDDRGDPGERTIAETDTRYAIRALNGSDLMTIESFR